MRLRIFPTGSLTGERNVRSLFLPIAVDHVVFNERVLRVWIHAHSVARVSVKKTIFNRRISGRLEVDSVLMTIIAAVVNSASCNRKANRDVRWIVLESVSGCHADSVDAAPVVLRVRDVELRKEDVVTLNEYRERLW
jgi:hypothetical protein